MTLQPTGRRQRQVLKPLTTALALALGVAALNPGAEAVVRSGAAPHLMTEFRQLRQQYPHPFFKNAKHHRLVHAGTPKGAPAVTSCVDNASSATTSGTLRYAVLNAGDGATIDLSALACSAITLTQGALPVTVDNLTINGPGSAKLAIDGNGSDRVFADYGHGTLAVNGLTVRNGAYTADGGQPVGGCIFAPYGEVSLTGAVVSGCSVTSTSTEKYGVAGGGGVAAYVLTMNSSTLSGNTATSAYSLAIGGGALCYGYYYAPDLAAKHGHKPKARNPHGIGGNTGALYHSTISGNTVSAPIALGGGIASKYGVYALQSTLSQNTAESVAPAVPPQNNTGYGAAGGGGFGIYGGVLVSSTVSGNSVKCGANTDCSTLAGGVEGFNLYYSTVSGNSATTYGGGVASKYGLNVANSTISGNTSAYGGGGVMLYGGPGNGSYIYNTTVANNTAVYGGGIYLLNGPPLTMVSTISAHNQASGNGADAYSYYNGGSGGNAKPGGKPNGAAQAMVAGSNNLVMVSANITLPGDTLHGDPQLGPLANHGGPTLTQLPGAASQAAGNGLNPIPWQFDQRGTGFPRTVANQTDIGAVQAAGATPVTTVKPAPTAAPWTLALMAALLGWSGLRRRGWPARRE